MTPLANHLLLSFLANHFFFVTLRGTQIQFWLIKGRVDFSVENRTSEDVTYVLFFHSGRPCDDIKLDPSNNSAREGFRLPTYGPPTKEVAHPCIKVGEMWDR